jgi:serine/threonine protein phosphatase PrpC
MLPARASACQRSKKGEDFIDIQHTDVGGVEIVILLVADGHGGSAAAEICVATLPRYIVDEADCDASAASLRRACASAIQRVQDDVLAATRTAGSTVSVVLINSNSAELTVASCGDSAVQLVESESETLLTEEHRLEESADERERVLASGSKLGRALNPDGIASGPLRAWPGGLAVCRTIGDADCPAALAEPAIRTVPFDMTVGAAVVVCSDGVWDAMTHLKVAAHIRRSRTPSEAAERVVGKAIKARGLRDDTSCLVAWLGTPPWDASLHESTRSRLGRDLGRSLSMAFGSRSPSASPQSSLMGTPVNSHNNLEELDRIAELHLDEHTPSKSSPATPTKLTSADDSAADLSKSPVMSPPQRATLVFKVAI